MAPARAACAEAGPTIRVSLNGLPITPPPPFVPGSRSTIGRTAGSAVTVSDPMVSGSHALFTVDTNGDVTVCDTGSSNGTFANGARIEGECGPLHCGDEVSPGSSNCRLRIELS